MQRTEKHLDTLKEIIKELEAKKKSNDYQLLVIKEEYEKTLKEIQTRNLEYLKKQGLIK